MSDKKILLLCSGLFAACCILHLLPLPVHHTGFIAVLVLGFFSLKSCPLPFAAVMLFSSGGDLAGSLGPQLGSSSAFMLQMALFAISHIIYIYYLKSNFFSLSRDSSLSPVIQGLGALILLGSVWCAFRYCLPEVENAAIRTGMVCYIFLIGLMAFNSIRTANTWLIISASLFMLSDLEIVLNRYAVHIPMCHLTVMLTYWSAQWLRFWQAASTSQQKEKN